MFQNLKNFIRHGKQAHQASLDGHKSHSQPNLHSDNEPKARAYDNAVKQIVAEEMLQSCHLPVYQKLERYNLIEKMGDGAFSIVYKALDTKTNQHVAVKVIRKVDLNPSQQDKHLGAAARKSENTGQRTTILKEVAIMRQLNHKNIVSLIDFRETPDYYFIVLELIPGGELFHQIVRLTYFSEDLSRHVIIQVAQAVRYLHEVAGVVHRDIKPENLLFYPCEFVPSKVNVIRKGEDQNKADEGEFIPGVGAGGVGVIKLADFGLSKIIWDNQTMTPCGTVGYTAPEIVKDEQYSKSVDMWALGCVLYTILCGFPPFYDESIEALTAKVAKGRYSFLSPWWDEISDEAKDAVSHLLEVDPDRRYTIDQFLSHPWVTKGGSISADTQEVPVMISPSTAAALNAPQLLTPAAAALKDAFDVSNAVYRMENDNRRANQFHNFNNNISIMEEEEDGDEDGLVIGLAGSKIGSNAGHKTGEKMATDHVDVHVSPKKKQHKMMGTGNNGFFELNLDRATLLGRRKANGNQGAVQNTAIPSFS